MTLGAFTSALFDLDLRTFLFGPNQIFRCFLVLVQTILNLRNGLFVVLVWFTYNNSHKDEQMEEDNDIGLV